MGLDTFCVDIYAKSCRQVLLRLAKFSVAQSKSSCDCCENILAKHSFLNWKHDVFSIQERTQLDIFPCCFPCVINMFVDWPPGS